jgi:adenosine deaminase
MTDALPLRDRIAALPKAELHVHLQGATRPETLLHLAVRNGIALPFETVEGLREWYQFRDFDHFIGIYDLICDCFCTAADLELAAREFIAGQAAERIVYTEVTYTPNRRIPFDEQLDALNRAREWGRDAHGIEVAWIIDIPREDATPEIGEQIADWAISGHERTTGRGVVALGLGGVEPGHPASKFARAFAKARAAGLPCVPHAGETAGADSIRDALLTTNPPRLAHGVRCLDDPALVDELRARRIALDVCPTSNVLLGVAPSLAEHPLPRLLAAGLTVTISTDDPPMFNTTLTDEYARCAEAFGWEFALIERLNANAFAGALLYGA